MERDDRVEDYLQEIGGHIVPPATESFRNLQRVDAAVLQAKQKTDPRLTRLAATKKDGVDKKKSYYLRERWPAARECENKRDGDFVQLIVSYKYGSDLLYAAHENPSSGHLGTKRTK